MDSLLPTQFKYQTPRLLHYVTQALLTLLPALRRHLWSTDSTAPDTGTMAYSDTYSGPAPPCVPFPTESSSAHNHLHRAQFSSRVVHQIQFKVITHSNNTRELFIEEIPLLGHSRCRDPEHYFLWSFGQLGVVPAYSGTMGDIISRSPLYTDTILFTMCPLRRHLLQMNRA